ncbi:MAG: PfkB family carbohydrate kinase [Pyrinomonadaceae bacterium]
MTNITDLIENTFPKKKVVIVGDLVADQFLKGTIARVSREAPVFILRHDDTATVPGGGANSAVNVASLGGTPILIGLTGTDPSGTRLLEELRSAGVDCGSIVTDSRLTTTTKVRVLAGQHYARRQQVIRIDYENSAEISSEIRQNLTANLLESGETADAIIISDYNYGVADPELAETARQIASARGVPLVIDSRFRLSDFHGATSATPNQDEVEHILGKNFTQDDCEGLRERLQLEALLVTCGNKGMLLVEKGKAPKQISAVGPSEPVDVTGAGDTVIAVYALGLASGLDFSTAAELANHAGGLVVMKKGTAFVSTGELLRSISEGGEFADAGHR